MGHGLVLVGMVLMLTALFSVASRGVCRFLQENPDEVPFCFVSRGEPLFLHVNPGHQFLGQEVILKNGDVRIARSIPGPVWNYSLHTGYQSRAEFFSNGTLQLDQAERRDTGRYQLRTYNTSGYLLWDFRLDLETQVPVSEPVLSLICLSGGETQVTCSSEGEPVEYRWGLDGQSLTNISISNQSHHNTTITLQGHMTGNLTCEVWNDVSTSINTIHLSTCSVVSERLLYMVLIKGVAVMAVILFLVSLCVWLSQSSRPRPSSTGDVDEGVDLDDIIYVEVVNSFKTDGDQALLTLDKVVYGQIRMDQLERES